MGIFSLLSPGGQHHGLGTVCKMLCESSQSPQLTDKERVTLGDQRTDQVVQITLGHLGFWPSPALPLLAFLHAGGGHIYIQLTPLPSMHRAG